MKRNLVLLLLLITALPSIAQPVTQDSSWKNNYRGSFTKINDLVHTRLEAKFDYQHSYLIGKVAITLTPHFYNTDSLTLDAKGMDISKVLLQSKGMTPLKYSYDGWKLKIKLDRSYKKGEKYIVFIEYTAKPNEVKVQGSAAINDAKGLYFINPTGAEKGKETQIWTQGETEGTSVWCPTIDKPNQKTTDEIIMTVPDKYVTLSNGKLISQKKNTDGTRTDHWKMDLPHSPYLFFMGVGNYAIIKDQYKGKEVSYYVRKEYASTARKIFGLTPQMIAFYEKLTGVAYPWIKYSQITGLDYVSGAMENTTATLHQESAEQDARELTDGNGWESTIAHELFHQWFGDYVTCESWSNLTVNESFADYSQYLWQEHKYGADAAGDENHNEMAQYFSNPENATKHLVRFYYESREDMFDLVSYQKGGRVLHMLRNLLGDSAFFKGLNLYLTTNKFKTGEAHQLRLAMEEVSGRDLNWFFNQWYFGTGHPVVTIDYDYSDQAKTVKVTIRQKQSPDNIFRIPVTIDIYNGAIKTRHEVWVTRATEIFTFPYTTKPDLVNVDAEKIILWEKKDNKTLQNFIHQYHYAANYSDRREAIDTCLNDQSNPMALNLLKTALKDKYFGLRNTVLDGLDTKIEIVKAQVEPILVDLATNEKNRTVRADAIETLGSYKKDIYKDLFKANLHDSSYSVAGAALGALVKIDLAEAQAEAKRQMKTTVKGDLSMAITTILIQMGSESDFDFIAGQYEAMPSNLGKFSASIEFGNYLSKVSNEAMVKRGVDLIVAFRESIPGPYRSQTDPTLNDIILDGLRTKKESAGLKSQADYIKSVLPK